MKISETNQSEFLNAADLKGQPKKVVLGDVAYDTVGIEKENMPVAEFQNYGKRWALNKTNRNALAQALGDETDDWFGKEVEVYPTTTNMQGKTVPCVRVRVVAAASDFGVNEDVSSDF